MSTIINNTEKNFSPEEQQAIRNAMAWAGVDTVITAKNPSDGQFDFYDEDDNYLFSIDTNPDGDCVIHDAHCYCTPK